MISCPLSTLLSYIDLLRSNSLFLSSKLMGEHFSSLPNGTLSESCQSNLAPPSRFITLFWCSNMPRTGANHLLRIAARYTTRTRAYQMERTGTSSIQGIPDRCSSYLSGFKDIWQAPPTFCCVPVSCMCVSQVFFVILLVKWCHQQIKSRWMPWKQPKKKLFPSTGFCHGWNSQRNLWCTARQMQGSPWQHSLKNTLTAQIWRMMAGLKEQKDQQNLYLCIIVDHLHCLFHHLRWSKPVVWVNALLPWWPFVTLF